MSITHLSASFKVNLGQTIIVVILMLCLGSYIAYESKNLLVHDQLQSLRNNNQFILNLLEAQHAEYKKRADETLSRFTHFVSGEWELERTSQKIVGRFSVPNLIYNKKELTNTTELVDNFTQLTGAVATIFVKQGDDFIRITSSLKKEDGITRAIGTHLDHKHPGYPLLLAGQSYLGKAKLFGKDYFTGYRPLLDKNGQIIGALFIGFDFTESLKSLKNLLSQMKVGETGYVFIVEANQKAKEYGQFIIHPTMQGKNILDMVLPDGKKLGEEIMHSKETTIHYELVNPKTGVLESKSLHRIYSASWQWQIISSAKQEEFLQTSYVITKIILVSAGIVLILLLISLRLMLKQLIFNPLDKLSQFIQTLTHQTTFGIQAPIIYHDEFGRLTQDVNLLSLELKAHFDEVNAIMASMAQGNFDQQITLTAKGDLAVLKENTNITIQRLKIMIQTITHMMNTLYRGEFNKIKANHIQSVLTGEFKAVEEKVMQTMQYLGGFIEELKKVFSELACGNFDYHFQATVHGDFNVLKVHINTTLEQIASTLQEVNTVMGAIASGNLTKEITHCYQGEFNTLTKNVNDALSSLRELLKQIHHTSQTLGEATAHISAGNMDLATRTAEQASSLESTTKKMEALAIHVTAHAKTAENASQVAKSSQSIAASGGHAMQNVTHAMNDMANSAQKIGDIINIIDMIAFQTNILALNAAVEAARAGEQGRGFAVVANEVQTLAQRSASAAKDISALIHNSIEKMSIGNQMAEQAENTIQNIIHSVENMTQLMHQMIHSSLAQTQQIEEVHHVIQQLDAITQQNSTLVEEIAATSEVLDQQSHQLITAINQFELPKHS